MYFVFLKSCLIILIFCPQFDEPTEDLPEFVAEEEAGFKGECRSHDFFFNLRTVTDCPLKLVIQHVTER